MKNFFIAFLFCFTLPVYSQQWFWAKTSSNPDNGLSHSVCTDPIGNLYVTGSFSSSTIIFGQDTLINQGSSDIYLVKYDPNGNVLWAKGAGGSYDEEGNSVCVDAKGNILITGYFNSTTVSFDNLVITNTGYKHAFVTKYDSAGNAIWAKSEGGDCAYSISADPFGNVFVTGWFINPSITWGSVTLTNSGVYDLFIAKMDSGGNVLWAKSAGGTLDDNSSSVCADQWGNVYVVGNYFSSHITFGNTTLNNSGGYDIFLAKYDSAGNVLWAQKAGGGSWDEGYSVSVDPTGSPVITGYFSSSTIAFGSTVFSCSNPGSPEMFIAKYGQNGNVIWARRGEGAGANSDAGTTINAARGKYIYVTGYFSSPYIVFAPDTLMKIPGNSYTMFIVKYNSHGSVICASALPTGSFINPNISGGYINTGLTTDFAGNAYIAAQYDTSPFILGADTLYGTTGDHVFIAKYNCDNVIGESVYEIPDIDIYPNPSDREFTLCFKNNPLEAQLFCYDIFGNCIWRQDYLNYPTTNIALTSFSKGIYLLAIHYNNYVFTRKIILN